MLIFGSQNVVVLNWFSVYRALSQLWLIMPKSIEELEEEILQLKQMLNMVPTLTDLGNLSAGFNITKQQAQVLLLLYNAKNNWLSKERLEYAIKTNNEECYNSKGIEVQISKIRKILGYEAIKTIQGIGYKLSDVGIEKCREVLES